MGYTISQKIIKCREGRVAEWFKASVLKTDVGATLPRVRIPPLPYEFETPVKCRGFCFILTRIGRKSFNGTLY